MFKTVLFYDIIQGMKNRTFILSALMCLYGATNALASDCTGASCDIETVWDGASAITETRTSQTIPVVQQYAEPVQQIYSGGVPMRQVKLLSIKPVEPDSRGPVWDGTVVPYTQRGYDKTVDWRDGVPIWDDSISDYTKKDFSDWFLQPTPELYLREVSEPQPQYVDPMNQFAIDLYNQNMADAAATRARVEELLTPAQPAENLWLDSITETTENTVVAPQESTPLMVAPRPEYIAQDMSQVVNVTFACDDGCPFETETECNIWRRKPIIRETVAPRSPKIRRANLGEFIEAARCNKNLTASDPVAAPLLDRYKMLMRSAQACCTDGMAYSLKQAGASDGLIYKFLADDANFYGLGARCLMMTDTELDTKYPNTATATVAADVRNGCLCRGRQWFTAMLAPFQQVYQAYPEFKNEKFYYTYTDGLQRKTTVSINNDVQNVLNQLTLCP